MKVLMTVTIAVILFPTAYFGIYRLDDESDLGDTALSCANPENEEIAYCTEIERAILASTVRIEMQSWIVYVENVGHTQLNGGGHATVKGGRYLVTHNHYDNIPLVVFADKELSQSITVSVYRANGELLLEAPATTISVAAVDAETLVFDFGAVSGVGLFESLGVPSATFLAVENSPLRPGTEVAQID